MVTDGNVVRVSPAYRPAVHDEPEDWALPSAAARHDLVAGHVGAQYFFDRHAPDRRTRAPDFGLQPLPPRRAFQILTSDGDHFTPLA